MSIGLAAAAMFFGFASGLMYHRQDHRLKHKIPPGKGLKLPSLEWLQHATVRSMVASTFLIGIGVLTGMVLNSIDRRQPEERLRWFDPLVLGTTIMFIWLLIAVHVSYLFKQARRGRIVAYLAVLSFLILVFVLAAGLLLNSQHGRIKAEGGRGKAEENIAYSKLSTQPLDNNPLSTLHPPLSPFQLPPSAFLDATPTRRL
jgi:formate hydrogenlyase subunit 3/multisubunit Na+/H+ antiporter MnhD subunit